VISATVTCSWPTFSADNTGAYVACNTRKSLQDGRQTTEEQNA